LSLNVKDVLQAPILRFDKLDSTNNYAAQMIDADTSQPGLTIIAHQQTAGKGQRGNIWNDVPDESLLMSIILQPKETVDEHFSFSAAVAVAVAELVQSLDELITVRIKFPNDIIIDDKKAAGILIENSIRGNTWTHAIVGVGINVLQHHFDNSLSNATSLFLATKKTWVMEGLLLAVRQRIIEYTMNRSSETMLAQYNQLLYKKGQMQKFSDGADVFERRVCIVNRHGKLILQDGAGNVMDYAHGQLKWVW
jgi:BirA family transcriptional regulator, biotin operon repressor / biotin---[acetyl-CoA-carboxylase] ligase